MSRERIVGVIFCVTILGISGSTAVKQVINSFSPEEELSDVNKGHEIQANNGEETNEEKSFVDSFTENLTGKEAGAAIGTKISNVMTQGAYIESTQVLAGKNGWLFYKATDDGDPISDYQGTNHYSDEYMATIASKLENTASTFNSYGVEFYVMSIPNKENVYSEYMPDSIERSDTVSKTDLLMAYLKNNSSVNVIDTKEALVDAKRQYQTYYKTDTHFNNVGAYIATQEVVKATQGSSDSIRNAKYNIVSTNYIGDLSQVCNMTDVYNGDIQYDFDGSNVNQSLKSDKRVLIIGDSFSDVIQPIMSNYYADVTAINIWSWHFSDLSSYNPDIIIWEGAERYTDRFDWISIA